jgi:hypothetical protein
MIMVEQKCLINRQKKKDNKKRESKKREKTYRGDEQRKAD